MPQSEGQEAGKFSFLGEDEPLFIPVFNQLGEAHPCCGGQSAFLSLSIYMLISSKNTHSEAFRIMFDQIFGHTVACQLNT